jgi:5S rRNA maturation endonuclease (ribonuclease M5)
MEKEALLAEVEHLKSSAVIVEGKKDKASLEKLGVKEVITLKRPVFEVCEEVSKKYREVAVLTDLDKEGRRLYSKVKVNLERQGVKINNNFRNFLFRETNLRQIEGLDTYIDNLP